MPDGSAGISSADAITAPDSSVGEDRLHVVFGTGQVGRALATHLASLGQWPELFPPLQHGVLATAEDNGALLVTLENLYGYGPARGRPMTEDLPLSATTVKGRTRVRTNVG